MSYPVDQRREMERHVLLMLCLWIARGTFRPGDKTPLPETLANQLLVSPYSVEVACRRLCSAGILNEQPGRTYTVADASGRARSLVAEWARGELQVVRSHLAGAGFTREEIAKIARQELGGGTPTDPGNL